MKQSDHIQLQQRWISRVMSGLQTGGMVLLSRFLMKGVSTATKTKESILQKIFLKIKNPMRVKVPKKMIVSVMPVSFPGGRMNG